MHIFKTLCFKFSVVIIIIEVFSNFDFKWPLWSSTHGGQCWAKKAPQGYDNIMAKTLNSIPIESIVGRGVLWTWFLDIKKKLCHGQTWMQYFHLWKLYNVLDLGLNQICVRLGHAPSHASFVAWSTRLHMRGNSSPLRTNVTIPGHLSCLAPFACEITPLIKLGNNESDVNLNGCNSNRVLSNWFPTRSKSSHAGAGRRLGSEGNVGGAGPNQMKMWYGLGRNLPIH